MPDSVHPFPDDPCLPDCAPGCAEDARDCRAIADRLSRACLRPTRQRVDLATLLFQGGGHRHVTAEQLHAEALAADMKVSLATVYNTLNQFRDAGLLREVVVEAGSTWFDTNTADHHHIFHENSRRLLDIAAEHLRLTGLPGLPPGTSLSRVDIIIRVTGGAGGD
ncbi:iron response transcriptional regulator IrrA [Niveispirillum fermenti]|uniref:iron response transcriptional regulator IrrA n=1 Tax=Niveispirillum fermenti TaxID=1233113 RepID=UPI003A838622